MKRKRFYPAIAILKAAFVFISRVSLNPMAFLMLGLIIIVPAASFSLEITSNGALGMVRAYIEKNRPLKTAAAKVTLAVPFEKRVLDSKAKVRLMTRNSLRAPGLKVFFLCAETDSGSHQHAIQVNVRYLRYGYTARRRLTRGEVLSPADYEKKMIDGGPVSGGAVDSVRQLRGMKLCRDIKKGGVIRRGDLTIHHAVRYGQPVILRYARGALSISGRGKAMRAGRIGDVIPVIVGRSRVMARVTGTRAAEVTL